MHEIIKNHLFRQIQGEVDCYIKDIEEVIQFMFKEVKDTMEKGELQRIDLQYLGSFYVNKYRQSKLESNNIKVKKKDDRNI